MSTIDERRTNASAGVRDDDGDLRLARENVATRIFLQPIAAPSVLGLSGFAAATFIVASNIAGWWGNHTTDPLVLAPFAALFGGVAQFAAGLWSYKARDAVATLAHGTWGAFWMAFFVLELMVATHLVPAPHPWYKSTAVGFWFFALAITTAIAAFAAAAENLGIMLVLSTLAGGSGILAGAYIYGSHGWAVVAGWVLVISAGLAWYTALAMVAAAAGRRTVFPLMEWKKSANVPGRRPIHPIEIEGAEPGVKMGQ